MVAEPLRCSSGAARTGRCDDRGHWSWTCAAGVASRCRSTGAPRYEARLQRPVRSAVPARLVTRPAWVPGMPATVAVGTVMPFQKPPAVMAFWFQRSSMPLPDSQAAWKSGCPSGVPGRADRRRPARPGSAGRGRPGWCPAFGDRVLPRVEPGLGGPQRRREVFPAGAVFLPDRLAEVLGGEQRPQHRLDIGAGLGELGGELRDQLRPRGVAGRSAGRTRSRRPGRRRVVRQVADQAVDDREALLRIGVRVPPGHHLQRPPVAHVRVELQVSVSRSTVSPVSAYADCTTSSRPS